MKYSRRRGYRKRQVIGGNAKRGIEIEAQLLGEAYERKLCPVCTPVISRQYRDGKRRAVLREEEQSLRDTPRY